MEFSWVRQFIGEMHQLKNDMLEIFILEHDVFPLLVLVALHDLVPGNFPAILLGNTLVVNRTQIVLAQQTKLEFLPSRSGIKGDGNINQTEADAAFPNCARHKNYFASGDCSGG